MNDERLPCGAALADLAEQWAGERAGERTPHQVHCEDCRTALEEMERLGTLLVDLAAEEVSVPEQIIARVMHRVRLIFEAGWHTVARTATGLTRVTAWVVTVVAERAGRSVPGVHRLNAATSLPAPVLSGRAPPRADDPAVDDHVRERTSLDVTIVARYGPDLRALSDAVRRAIIHDVDRLVGVDIDELNVEITDVYER